MHAQSRHRRGAESIPPFAPAAEPDKPPLPPKLPFNIKEEFKKAGLTMNVDREKQKQRIKELRQLIQAENSPNASSSGSNPAEVDGNETNQRHFGSSSKDAFPEEGLLDELELTEDDVLSLNFVNPLTGKRSSEPGATQLSQQQQRPQRENNAQSLKPPRPQETQGSARRRRSATDKSSAPSRNTAPAPRVKAIAPLPDNSLLVSKTHDSLFVLAVILGFRLFNASLLRTYQDPDEHWQSLEVAHKFLHGQGYLTWEWSKGLRGFAFPGIFAFVWWVLEELKLSTDAMILLSKLVMACFASVGDYYTWKLACRFCGSKRARWALFVTLVSGFNFNYSVRTLSNVIEAVFCTVAMFYWPWPHLVKYSKHCEYDFIKSLVGAAVACILRPTNGVIWLILGLHLLYCTPTKRERSSILFDVSIVACLAITVSMTIDLKFYGSITFPPWNFIRFNLIEDIASFYGTHPWHWYFSTAIPSLLLTYFPVFLVAVKNVTANVPSQLDFNRRVKPLLSLIVITIAIYSMLDHKELRFLMPVVPLLHIITATALAQIPRQFLVLPVLAITQIVPGIYLANVHQRGVMDVMDYLRHDGHVKSVGFLMPCHSTPFHERLRKRDITMRFLTCEPPVGLKNKTGYMDESDIFYADPSSFIATRFPLLMERKQLRKKKVDGMETDGERDANESWTWPTHLIYFESLQDHLHRWLDGSEYRECARFFNTHWHPDPRRRGDVIVMCNNWDH